MKKNQKDDQITIRISKKKKDKFLEFCKIDNLVYSEVIRGMIDKFIDSKRHKKIHNSYDHENN